MAEPSLPHDQADPFREPFSTVTARDAIAKASDAVAECRRSQFAIALHVMGPIAGLESPIEAVFWIWWQALDAMRRDEGQWALKPQHHVAIGTVSYRLDFAVFGSESGECAKVGIELDGHDFHERTPDQVANRDSRDRKLQSEGWVIFHFSGRELLRDPFACVAEVWLQCDKARGTRGADSDD